MPHQVLVLGDVHGDNPENREYLNRAYKNTSAKQALQVGDLSYYQVPLPTWFIAGNNEDWAVIEKLRNGVKPEEVDENLHLLASTRTEIDGKHVAGLSGNYAPTQFEKSRAELEGDRRRHFTHEDVEALKAHSNIDIILAHEAPRGLIEKRGADAGCQILDDILRELSPELCLIGHHHEHAQNRVGGSKVVSLAGIWDGYYTLDLETLRLEFNSWENQSLSAF